MDPVLIPAVITGSVALVAALLTGVYANGGRDALRRRVIKQELEILEKLPDDDPSTSELTQKVHDRIALYLGGREALSELSERRRWGFFFICCLVMVVWAIAVARVSPEYLNSHREVVRLSVLVLFAAIIGAGIVIGLEIAEWIRARLRNGYALRVSTARAWVEGRWPEDHWDDDPF